MFDWKVFDQTGSDEELMKQTYKYGVGYYLKERDPSLVSSLFANNTPPPEVLAYMQTQAPQVIYQYQPPGYFH